MFQLKDINTLVIKNISLRTKVFNDCNIDEYKKEKKLLLNKLKKVKSQVVRKSMIRSIVMKNILLRFIEEDSSFLES